MWQTRDNCTQISSTVTKASKQSTFVLWSVAEWEMQLTNLQQVFDMITLIWTQRNVSSTLLNLSREELKQLLRGPVWNQPAVPNKVVSECTFGICPYQMINLLGRNIHEKQHSCDLTSKMCLLESWNNNSLCVSSHATATHNNTIGGKNMMESNRIDPSSLDL